MIENKELCIIPSTQMGSSNMNSHVFISIYLFFPPKSIFRNIISIGFIYRKQISDHSGYYYLYHINFYIINLKIHIL